LWLEGSPGVGKSWVIKTIAARFCPSVAPRNRIYARDTDDKYYSNYAGQPIFVIDDFCCGRTFTDSDNASLKALLTLMSPEPPTLNQAEIGLKGNVHFTSPLVAVTTMRSLTQTAWPLLHIGSLIRRFFALRVELRDEYSKDGVCDEEKVAAHVLADPSNPAPHLRFIPYVYTADTQKYPHNRVLGKEIPFSEVVSHLQNLYIVRLANAKRSSRADVAAPLWTQKDFVSFTAEMEKTPPPKTYAKAIKQLAPLKKEAAPTQAAAAPFEEEKKEAGPPKPPVVKAALPKAKSKGKKTQAAPKDPNPLPTQCHCWYQCPKSPMTGDVDTLCKVCDRFPCPQTCAHPTSPGEIKTLDHWLRGIRAWMYRTGRERRHDRHMRRIQRWMHEAVIADAAGTGRPAPTFAELSKLSLTEFMKTYRVTPEFLIAKVWCPVQGKKHYKIAEVPPPEASLEASDGGEIKVPALELLTPEQVNKALATLGASDPDEVLVTAFSPEAAAEIAANHVLPLPPARKTLFRHLSDWYYQTDFSDLAKILSFIGVAIAAAVGLAKLLLPVEEQSFATEASGGPNKERLAKASDREAQRKGKKKGKSFFVHKNNPGPGKFVMGNGKSFVPEALVTDPKELSDEYIATVQAGLNRAYKGTGEIRRSSPDGSFRMHCVFPGGREVWCPRHFFYEAPEVLCAENSVITVTTSLGVSYTMLFHQSNLRGAPIGKSWLDVVSFDLPKHAPMMPTLRDKMPSDVEGFDLRDAHVGVVIRAPCADPDEIYVMLDYINRSSEHLTYSVSGSAQPHHLTLPGYYFYNHHSAPGDCGAPVVMFGKGGNMTIIGMHVGTRREGISVCGTAMPFLSHMFDNSFTCEGKMEPPSLLPCNRTLPFTEASLQVFSYLGEHPVPRYVNGKNGLVATTLKKMKHPLVAQVVHKPAVLHSPDRPASLRTFEAMLDIAPEGPRSQAWDEEIAEPIVQLLEERARTLRRAAEEPRQLTKDEALNGALSRKWMDMAIKRLAMNRTPGYPYDAVKPLGAKGRAWLFQKLKDEHLGFNPDYSLEKDLDDMLALTDGDPYPWIAYILGLKQELRRPAKVETPRLIAYSSVLLTLAVRVEFGTWIMTDYFRNGFPSSVGINVDSLDWHRLWERLLSHFRDLIIAGDFRFFDSIINPQIISAYKRVSDAYYGDVGNKFLRHFLLDNCMVAFLIIGSSVFKKVVGGTTGNPLTVHLNNFTNEFTLRCAFRALALKHDPKYSSPDAFDLETGLATYGDDFVSTHTDKTPWYTFNSLQEILATKGITMTSPAKDDAKTPDHFTLDEVTYLSRNVRTDPSRSLNGAYYLAENRGEDFRSVAYRLDKLDDEFAVAANFTGILYRSVGRGREGWQALKAKIDDALADCGYSPKLPSWAEVTRNFYTKEYNFTEYQADETLYELYNAFANRHLKKIPDGWLSSPSLGMPAPSGIVFSCEMEAVLHEHAVPPESKDAPAVEDLAPPVPIAKNPCMLSSTVEDMMKVWQPWYNDAVPVDVRSLWMSSMFCVDSADGGVQSLVPAYLTYYSSFFRFYHGPPQIMITSDTGNVEKGLVTYTNTLGNTSVVMQTQLGSNLQHRLAGSVSLQAGMPGQFPLMVSVPAQQLNPENMLFVPHYRSEIFANPDPNLWGGSWSYSFPTIPVRVYATIGDGTRFSRLYRIPQISYPFLTPPIVFEPEGAVQSTATKGLKSVTGTMANLAHVTDAAIDVANETANRFSRFDTPDSAQQEVFLGQFAPPMAMRSVLRRCQPLASINEPPETNLPFGTNAPETRLLGLCMREIPYVTARIDITMEAGHEILRMPITPCPDTFSATSSAFFQPTLVEAVTIPFTYWKGPLRLRAQFVNCFGQTCRVAVITRFGEFGTPVTVADASSQYAVVQNIGLEDSFEVSIPYITPQNWCRVPVPDPLGRARLNPLDYATGEIIVMLISPMQSNETMPDEMDINFYLAAGPEFEFKTPAENLASLTLDDTTFLESKVSFEPEMLRTGAVGGENKEDEEKQVLVLPPGGPVRTTTPNDGADALWARSFVLPELVWLTTAPVGTLLFNASLPLGILPEGPVKTLISSFKFIRCSLEFTFGMSTTLTQSGQICAFFVPPLVNAGDMTFKDMVANPHVLLKAGDTKLGKLLCQYEHPRNALDLSLGGWRSNFGALAVAVVNQLRSGASAPATFPTIQMSVRFVDMELSVPNPASPVGVLFSPEVQRVRPRLDLRALNRLVGDCNRDAHMLLTQMRKRRFRGLRRSLERLLPSYSGPPGRILRSAVSITQPLSHVPEWITHVSDPKLVAQAPPAPLHDLEFLLKLMRHEFGCEALPTQLCTKVPVITPQMSPYDVARVRTYCPVVNGVAQHLIPSMTALDLQAFQAQGWFPSGDMPDWSIVPRQVLDVQVPHLCTFCGNELPKTHENCNFNFSWQHMEPCRDRDSSFCPHARWWLEAGPDSLSRMWAPVCSSLCASSFWPAKEFSPPG